MSAAKPLFSSSSLNIVGRGDERVPVGAADREVDRRAARRAEALLRRVLHRAADARDPLEVLAQRRA